MWTLPDWLRINSWEAVGALVAVLTAAAGLAEWLRRSRGKPARLVVEAVQHQSRRGSPENKLQWPSLSMTLRNKGRETAVIDEIDCEVVRRWNLQLQDRVAFLVHPTSYDLAIDRNGPIPQTISVGVTHAIPSESVDKLQVDLTATPEQGIEEIFQLAITFRYGLRRTDPVSVIVAVPDASATNPPYFYGDLKERMKGVKEFVAPGVPSTQYTFLKELERLAPGVDAANRAILKEVGGLAPQMFVTPRVRALLERATTAEAAPRASLAR